VDYRENRPKEDIRQSQSDEGAMLENQIKQLKIITHGLWEIVRDSLELSEEDLIEAVKDIQLDREHQGSLKKKCYDCSRENNPKQLKCLYCGGELAQLTAFDALG